MKIKKPYEKQEREQLICDDLSLTKQSFKKECDVNHILAKYAKTGVMEHVKHNELQYGDVSNLLGYKEGLDRIHEANELFAGLPAIVRKKFDNDPALFLEHVSDPANVDSMRELGLLKQPQNLEDKVSSIPETSKNDDGKTVEKQSAQTSPT